MLERTKEGLIVLMKKNLGPSSFPTERMTFEDWIFQPVDGKWRAFKYSMQKEVALSKNKSPERTWLVLRIPSSLQCPLS